MANSPTPPTNSELAGGIDDQYLGSLFAAARNEIQKQPVSDQAAKLLEFVKKLRGMLRNPKPGLNYVALCTAAHQAWKAAIKLKITEAARPLGVVAACLSVKAKAGPAAPATVKAPTPKPAPSKATAKPPEPTKPHDTADLTDVIADALEEPSDAASATAGPSEDDFEFVPEN